jgi:hypothetical protein
MFHCLYNVHPLVLIFILQSLIGLTIAVDTDSCQHFRLDDTQDSNGWSYGSVVADGPDENLFELLPNYINDTLWGPLWFAGQEQRGTEVLRIPSASGNQHLNGSCHSCILFKLIYCVFYFIFS